MSKRYTVIGSQPVLDHQPGETFAADLPADQERFLTLIGAIKVASLSSEAFLDAIGETDDQIKDEVKRLNVESHKRR